MANRFYGDVIANELENLIKTNLTASLNLRVVTVGEMSYFREPSSLVNAMPFVVIIPTKNRGTLGFTEADAHLEYLYRIIYCRIIEPLEVTATITVQNTEQILELLCNYPGMTELTSQPQYSNLRIERMWPTRVEWEPREGKKFERLTHQIDTVAITVSAKAIPQR